MHDIGELYAIDREADALDATPDERLRLRKQKGPEIRARMKARLVGWRDRYSEASSMAKALTYLENQWEPLGRFLEHGLVPLDNNRCYAARGITSIMPLPGLCRVGAERSAYVS
jgi:transposase